MLAQQQSIQSNQAEGIQQLKEQYQPRFMVVKHDFEENDDDDHGELDPNQ